MKCTFCGAELAEGSKFCTNCGAPAVEGVPAAPKSEPRPGVCPACGAELEEGQRFCTRCGKRVDLDAGAPAVGPAPSDASAGSASPQGEPASAVPASQAVRPAPSDGQPTMPADPLPAEPSHAVAGAAESVDATVALPVIKPASVQNAASDSEPPARKPRRIPRWALPVAVALILVVSVGTAAAVTGGFGLLIPSDVQTASDQGAAADDAADQAADTEEDTADAEDGDTASASGEDADADSAASAAPAVRASVSDYSWDELSQISALIAQASTDAEGLQIAQQYHLCAAGGTLDGTQTKQVTLKDGTATSVQVAGFRHDDRSDGQGKAGITFIFTDAVATRPYDDGGSNAGGWCQSDLRQWCNSELLARMPDDLQRVLVAADKLTNNTGYTYDPSAVTVTSDRLWIPSYNEIIGDVDPSLGDNLPVFNAEGDKYQLFIDTDVLWSAANAILVKSLAGSGAAVSWWQRSPYPDNADYVMDTGADGIPYYAHVPTKDFGVVPGFCI